MADDEDLSGAMEIAMLSDRIDYMRRPDHDIDQSTILRVTAERAFTAGYRAALKRKWKKLDVNSGDLCCKLKRSSWENLFLVLGEHGLGQITRERLEYLASRGIWHTDGNFWATVQELQRQYHEQTGVHPKTHHL